MLSREAWRILEGSALNDGVLLRELIDVHSSAVFRATAGSEPLLVRFWDSEYADPNTVVNRNREAAYLTSPGLLRVLHSGLANSGENTFAYAVYEAPDALLTDYLSEKPRTMAEVSSLGIDLAEALEHLHAKGLAYCALDPWTVARKGGRWVLADYSQLRLIGNEYARETRKLLVSYPAAPPEAFDGVVSPAWDAWSLAHLLRACLLGPQQPRKAGEPRPHAELPELFVNVLSACATMDPTERCSVRDIAERLRTIPVTTPVPRSEPAMGAPLPPAAQEEPRVQQTYLLDAPDEPSSRRLVLMAAAGFLTVLLLFLLFGRDKSAGTQRVNPQRTAEKPAGIPHPLDLPVGTQPETVARGGGMRSRAATDAELRDVVSRWASSYRSKNLDTHMALYAPKVDRFFLRRNVPADVVRKTKQQALASAGEVRQYDIENVETNLQTADRAIVTLDKTYAFGGAKPNAGKVRSQLTLQKVNESWKIVGERDLRVFWKKGA